MEENKSKRENKKMKKMIIIIISIVCVITTIVGVVITRNRNNIGISYNLENTKNVIHKIGMK